jgi:hypothetical protein
MPHSGSRKGWARDEKVAPPQPHSIGDWIAQRPGPVVVALDCSTYFYGLICGHGSRGLEYLLGRLWHDFYNLVCLLPPGSTLFLVLDGVAPPEKRYVQDRRRQQRRTVTQDAVNKAKQALDQAYAERGRLQQQQRRLKKHEFNGAAGKKLAVCVVRCVRSTEC